MSVVWERGTSSREMKPLFLLSNSLLTLSFRSQLGDETRQHPLLAPLTRLRFHASGSFPCLVSFLSLIRSSASEYAPIVGLLLCFSVVREDDSSGTKVSKPSSFAFRRIRMFKCHQAILRIALDGAVSER